MLRKALKKLAHIIIMIVVAISVLTFANSRDIDYELVKDTGLSNGELDKIFKSVLIYQIDALSKVKTPSPSRYMIMILDGYPERQYLQNLDTTDARIRGGYLKHADERCRTAAISLDELRLNTNDSVEVKGTLECGMSYQHITYAVELDSNTWHVISSSFQYDQVKL